MENCKCEWSDLCGEYLEASELRSVDMWTILENLWFCVEVNMTWRKLSRTIVSFSIFLIYYLLWLNDQCNGYQRHGSINDVMFSYSEWCYYARYVCASIFYCISDIVMRSVEW